MRPLLQIAVLLLAYLACQDMTGACGGGCGKRTDARADDAAAK